MENTPPQIEKKGLGALAWIGIGCGGLIALVVIGFVVVTMMFGGKIKEFAENAQKDPARTTATMMVSMSAILSRFAIQPPKALGELRSLNGKSASPQNGWL